MNLLKYGGEALLVELADAEEAAALRASLDDNPPAGIVETMPGLRTVLVRFDIDQTDADQIARTISARGVSSPPTLDNGSGADAVPVRADYAGADLDEVAAWTGLTPDEVVAAHQAPTYRVVMIGLAPASTSWPAATVGCRSRVDGPRAPTCRRAWSHWPASSLGSIPASAQAAGNSSARARRPLASDRGPGRAAVARHRCAIRGGVSVSWTVRR